MISPSRDDPAGRGQGHDVEPERLAPAPGRRDRRRRWGRPRPPAPGMASVPRATKRARLSTWPSVWSLSSPSPSQSSALDARDPRAAAPRRRLAGQAGIAVGVEQALLGGDARGRCRRRRSRRLPGPSRPRPRPGRRVSASRRPIVSSPSQLIFAAPAVEAEAWRAARLPPLPRMIGPVSRSQMSPNGSSTTVANGRRARRAASAAAGSAATSRTSSPSPSAQTARAKAATSVARRLEIVDPEVGMARKADPDQVVRRPFRAAGGGGRAFRPPRLCGDRSSITAVPAPRPMPAGYRRASLRAGRAAGIDAPSPGNRGRASGVRG